MASSTDLDRQIEQLRNCELIKESEVKAICAKAREILVEEANVQRVDSPVTVCRNVGPIPIAYGWRSMCSSRAHTSTDQSLL